MACPYAGSLDGSPSVNATEQSTASLTVGADVKQSVTTNIPVEHKEPLNYTTYLHIEPLLSTLKCLSHSDPMDETSPHVHDEHFFILIHQVFELWFKQILFEIDSIRKIFGASATAQHAMKSMFDINARLNRCVKIWNILIPQLSLLETMTPIEFLEFRDFITPASGFQSLQFRIIEFKLGVTDKARSMYRENYFLKTMFKNHQADELEAARNEEPLLVLLERWLEQVYDGMPFDFRELYEQSAERFIEHGKKEKLASGKSNDSVEAEAGHVKRQYSQVLNREEHEDLRSKNIRRMSHKAMLAALMISVYHQQPCFQQAYQMLHLLMDIDTLIAQWRQKHLLLVHRQIGQKRGTGGTDGFLYLAKTLDEQYRVFVDLFNVASYLIPQRFLPRISDSSNSFSGLEVSTLPFE